MKIKVNYHSSVIINNEIFIDPLKVNDDTKAKYIFITHPHWDHFSIEDIKKILTKSTTIICPKTMQEEIEKLFNNQIIYVEPQKEYVLGNISFETFCSYNQNKEFHPKENLWVGYNLNLNNQKVAILGDSDNTAELRKLKTDILLVPIGGTYTMDVKEAVELTNTINPQKVIPTHYGNIVGTKEMGEEFKKLINKNIICELLI